MALVRKLIDEAKEQLERRAEEDAEDETARQSILSRFRVGLEKHGCQVKELLVKTPDNTHRVTVADAMVWIDLVKTTDGSGSWFSVGLGGAFENHFPEAALNDRQSAPYESHWNDVAVPALWDPERVGAWICDAVAFDVEKHEEEAASRQSAEAEKDRALADLKRLIDEPSPEAD